MKKIFFLAIVSLLIIGCSDKTKNATSKFIKVYKIEQDINSSIDIIKNSIKDKNYKVVSIFNHSKEAKALKEMLYPTKSIEIYNSKISTKLIQCNPTISLEMPIRITLYSKINGEVFLGYTDPEYWSLKHNVKDAECIKLLQLIKSDLYDIKIALGAK